ncbi:hypothetical protein L1887_61482 [Cichorium endivia]|nr:hypothetical protein L1887_61482 [Cichorium endivia]
MGEHLVPCSFALRIHCSRLRQKVPCACVVAEPCARTWDCARLASRRGARRRCKDHRRVDASYEMVARTGASAGVSDVVAMMVVASHDAQRQASWTKSQQFGGAVKQVEDQRQEQRCSCKVQPCKANAACAGKGSSRNNFTGGCAFGGLALRCCRSETRRRERFFGHPTASPLRTLFCRRPGAGFTWLLAWQLGCSVAPSAATLGRLSASVELRTTDPPSELTWASGICL